MRKLQHCLQQLQVIFNDDDSTYIHDTTVKKLVRDFNSGKELKYIAFDLQWFRQWILYHLIALCNTSSIYLLSIHHLSINNLSINCLSSFCYQSMIYLSSIYHLSFIIFYLLSFIYPSSIYLSPIYLSSFYIYLLSINLSIFYL